MNFTSIWFIVIFPIALFLYPRLKNKRLFLLLISWLLFALGSVPSFFIMLGVTVVSYICGRGMERGYKKAYLTVAILSMVLVLSVFKYLPGALLPAGISFYTFQAMSYCIDVYRGKLSPCKRFGDLALYISFFPQVVAGPIERPGELLPRLLSGRRADEADFRLGGFLILRGYLKKVAMADVIAPVCDGIFSSGEYSGPLTVAGAVLFGVQIYTDFSGYSDIACGSAALLGIKLSKNFDNPYLSSSLAEFWRRWHITLMRWFLDYIYIPLGGSRAGRGRTVINILVVFALSGLWHGGAWHFILWGVLHGVFMVTERLISNGGRVVTLFVVMHLWIMFRAESVGEAVRMYGALPLGWGALGEQLFSFIRNDLLLALRIAVIPVLLFLTKNEPDISPSSAQSSDSDIGTGKDSIGFPTLVAGYAAFIYIVVSCCCNVYSGGDNAFLYFRF